VRPKAIYGVVTLSNCSFGITFPPINHKYDIIKSKGAMLNPDILLYVI
jgi:hypothetical protein